MAMLNAFKIKPFDLEPVFSAWTDGPRFSGNPKKDPPVDAWLESIKAGCVERNVPEEYWHKVAQHFMGDKAKARLNELKSVMAKVHGGKYRWTWKKFKIAMMNMGWEIETSATQAIKVQTKSSGGLWWAKKKDDTPSSDLSETAPSRPVPVKSMTIDSSSFWLMRRKKSEDEEPATRPSPQKVKSDTQVVTTKETAKPPPPSRAGSMDTAVSTTVTHAPVWLLNACNALDFLNTEHPKVMSTISAILITVGTLPTLPAISAGAGGAILASGAAHAVGAIAVGVGSWMQAQQNGQAQTPPTSH